MRIDTLVMQNFKKFQQQEVHLQPHFTLLIGENGSGKTSVLDALAVALGLWLVEPPDSTLNASGRNILSAEIRLEPTRTGDRILFRERRPVIVSAVGKIGDVENISWKRQIRETGRSTTNLDAKAALATISEIYRKDHAGDRVLCPVIAYYGAGRAWLPSNQRIPEGKPNGPARRWAAFYDCLNERIRLSDLKKWFRNELIAAGQLGHLRSGFEVVRHAVINCVPKADDLWFDADLDQIVLSIDGSSQPFGNLSAGQQMMLALVADIAIKAVTQNTHLVPEKGLGTKGGPLPEVLERTPGVILIDEIDVHLHPAWQRSVVRDLMRTFPSIQFIATTHSPQVIGELPSNWVVLFDKDGNWSQPMIGTKGAQSNEILRFVMGATDQNATVDQLEEEIDVAIDDDNLPLAELLYKKFLNATEEPTIQRHRLQALIENERTFKQENI